MKNIRILLVDDEPYIVNSIAMLIEDQPRYGYEVLKAYSGAEALHIMQERKIDILITDIKMPDVDGLDLIRHAKVLWKRCKCLLFSAYADFKFAREAIQIGADGYMLKTDDDDEIIHKIEEVVQIVQADITQIDRPEEDRLNTDNSFLLHNAFAELLENSHCNNDDELQKAVQSLGCKDLSKPFLLTVVITQSTSNDSLTQRIHIVKSCFLSSAEFVYVDFFKDNLCILFQPRNSKLTWITDMIDDVQEELKMLTYGKTKFILSQKILKPVEISLRYKQIISLIENKILDDDVDEYIYVVEKSMKISSLMKSNETIITINNYIEKNIFSDLSLTTLSKLTGYNSSYLSRLYLARTGISLSKYIANKKLEHIMPLIKDTTLTLNEVFQLSGFETRSYFNRFIKHNTGKSPHQLRE